MVSAGRWLERVWKPGLSEDEIPPPFARPRCLLPSLRLRADPRWSLTGEGESGAPPMGVAAHAVVWCSGRGETVLDVSLCGLCISNETWTCESSGARPMAGPGTTGASALGVVPGKLDGSRPFRFPRRHSWKADTPQALPAAADLPRVEPGVARCSRSSAIFKLSAMLRWRLPASDAES